MIRPRAPRRSARRTLSTVVVVVVVILVGAAPSLGRNLDVFPQASLPGPLYGIEAITATDIWAVGTRTDPNDPDEDIGLAEHWNGATWQEVPTPPFGELSGSLFDVSGTSSNDVWAVGSDGQPSFNDKQLAIEHWDGAAWRLVDAPMHP